MYRLPNQKTFSRETCGIHEKCENPATVRKMGVDFIGPFPLTKTGNRYIIVAVDYLTKWVMAQPVPHAGTREVVNFFIRMIVLQHGAPVYLISYRGKCLTAGFAEEMYRALQTNHFVTTAYHPQCNGLVERFNPTFAEKLSMYVSSCHDDWDEVVDFVVFAYNTSRQEKTGLTPFFLLYGREAMFPIDVSLGRNPNPVVKSENSAQNIRGLSNRLSVIREQMKRRLIVVQAKQIKRYDHNRRTVRYAVGDLVWIHRPLRKMGRSQKLLHPFFGPYKVVQQINELNYVVVPVNERKKTRDRVHVCNLKPYFTRHSDGVDKILSVDTSTNRSVVCEQPTIKTDKQAKPTRVRNRIAARPPKEKDHTAQRRAHSRAQSTERNQRKECRVHSRVQSAGLRRDHGRKCGKNQPWGGPDTVENLKSSFLQWKIQKSSDQPKPFPLPSRDLVDTSFDSNLS
jgi:hypothetical protein